jgi:ribosomal protein S18 acetylase RimI-like enzyme
MQKVTTYYLEMNSADNLLEKTDANGFVVIEAEVDEFRFNKFLYILVGAAWLWTDKLALSDEQWRQHVENPHLKTWVAYFKGSIAGYFELSTEPDGNTEIMYFGLAESFIGKGFGGYLLSKAIKSAWQIPTTKRVWVHTCSLDHQAALSNYQRRGFEIYKTETTTKK